MRPIRECRQTSFRITGSGLLLLIASVVVGGAPEAVKAEGPTTPAQFLLESGRLAELDAQMNGLQAAYQANTLDDLSLINAFANSFPLTARDEVILDSWIQAYPQSYSAHLARGIYYFKSGVQTRGRKYTEHTTAAQLDGMTVYLKKAKQDFEDSLTLNAKPIASYHYLELIAKEFDDTSAKQSLLEDSLKLDPGNVVVLRPYLSSLETRWGGSLQQMQAFVDERQARLTPRQTLDLNRQIDRERKWLAHHPKDAEDSKSAETLIDG